MNDMVRLERAPEGMTLTLRAPDEGEQDVAYQELVGYLEGLGLPSLDFAAVKHAYKRERGRPLLISPGAQEVFKVEVNADEMEADVVLYDWKSEAPDALEARILKALEAKGVTHGLKREALKQALSKGVCFERVSVAEGRLPEEGSDVTVHHPVVPPELELPEGRGVESMRVWSEPFIVVVEPESVVAEKRRDGAQGKDGVTVTGRPLPAPAGSDIDLEGKNVVASDDGTQLKAAEKGQLIVRPQGADVMPVREVEGDLEGMGNAVKFDGSVVVRGAVRDGAIIRATADVEVWGPVSSAVIMAGRNLVLRDEVVGLGETSIRAGGNIAAVSVEGAEIAAKDSLFVRDALLKCRAGARRRVMMGPEGKLAGGTVVAGEHLQVAYLGDTEGERTIVKVATPELLPKWLELYRERLLKQMAPHKEKASKLRQGIEALKKRKARRAGQLEPQNEQLLVRMERDLAEVTLQCQEIELRAKKLPGREKLAEAGKIIVLKGLSPKVVINLGSVNLSPRNEDETRFLMEGPEGITAQWIESCLASF